jgi:hypothetical protein
VTSLAVSIATAIATTAIGAPGQHHHAFDREPGCGPRPARSPRTYAAAPMAAKGVTIAGTIAAGGGVTPITTAGALGSRPSAAFRLRNALVGPAFGF